MTKTNYLGHCRNMTELKAEYKKLAKILHPDMGGSDEEMAILNDQYDVLSTKLPMINAEGKEYQPSTREAPEEFRAAVLAVMFLSGVELELCGTWLWATGNTRSTRKPSLFHRRPSARAFSRSMWDDSTRLVSWCWML